MVEEIISYKTLDGRTFIEKEQATGHAAYLENKKKLAEAAEEVKQIFIKELALFVDSVKEYDDNLETDFWYDESQALANDANVDITIENFEEYVCLVKALLEGLHLEETIKIVKKMMCDSAKEKVNETFS